MNGLPTLGSRPRASFARVLLAAIAIALVAWFAVLARNHSIGSSASARIVGDPGMSATEWRDVMNRFDGAHVLDPSSDWTLVKAQWLLLRDPPAALALAERVLEDEPANLSAWWVVLRATRGTDAERWREAAAAIRRLNPLPAAG